MPNEHFNEWLEALESGEYEQGEGRLVSAKANGTYEYCCMGVACALAEKAGIVELRLTGRFQGDDADFVDPRTGGKSYTGYLPDVVAEWMGIDLGLGLVTYDVALQVPATGEIIAATIANDMRHLTFPEIADGLRRYHLGEVRC